MEFHRLLQMPLNKTLDFRAFLTKPGSFHAGFRSQGAWEPIPAAIEGCQLDRVSRLTRTLVWLRERALTVNLGNVQLDHLNRFINAVDYPPAARRFFAVAVICSSLVSGELATAPAQASPDFSLVIVSVANLRRLYSSVYDAIRHGMNPANTQDTASA
jgi:hypothetical protein